MKIIAFGHRRRVGKDTAAHFFFRELNRPKVRAVRSSFADGLKDTAYRMYAWAGLKPGPWYEQPENQGMKEVLLPAINRTPRDIWIALGEAGRAIAPLTWVALSAARIPAGSDFAIYSDMRHWNELDYTIASEGYDIKIENPRVPKADDVVDNALESYQNWAGVIVNDNTMEKFEEKCALAVKLISNDKRGWAL